MSLLQLEWVMILEAKLKRLENRRFLRTGSYGKKPTGANSPGRGVAASVGCKLAFRKVTSFKNTKKPKPMF